MPNESAKSAQSTASTPAASTSSAADNPLAGLTLTPALVETLVRTAHLDAVQSEKVNEQTRVVLMRVQLTHDITGSSHAEKRWPRVQARAADTRKYESGLTGQRGEFRVDSNASER